MTRGSTLGGGSAMGGANWEGEVDVFTVHMDFGIMGVIWGLTVGK